MTVNGKADNAATVHLQTHNIAVLCCSVDLLINTSSSLSMICGCVCQVRVVVERLARRLGYDAVADNIPEEHRKLLTHIRKEKTRKLREDKAEKVCCANFCWHCWTSLVAEGELFSTAVWK